MIKKPKKLFMELLHQRKRELAEEGIDLINNSLDR